MSRLLRRLTSVRNLENDPRPSGQIATLLLLATVILLTFVLVTVNVGNVATQSTAIANAADTSSLYLASALATKSRQLHDGLEGYESCYKTGYASLIIAIVVIVIVLVLTIMTCGAGAVAVAGAVTFVTAAQAVGTVALMAVGAVAGAAGGAIGAAIAGTDPARGALTGAALGAACGAIVGAAVAAPALGTASVGATSSTTLPAATGGTVMSSTTSGATAAVSSTAAGLEPIAVSAGMQIAAGSTVVGYSGTVVIGIGSIAGLGTGVMGALSVGSSIYNEVTFQGEALKALDDIVKALGKATETDRIRETAIIKAMVGLIDDPNYVVDEVDSDFDANTTELVPAAQVWLYRRTAHIRELTDANESNINRYISQLNWMMNYLSSFLNGSGEGAAHQPGLLEISDYRFELVRDADGNVTSENIVENTGNDGLLAKSFKSLEASGGNLTFFDPSGPTVAQYTELMDRDCTAEGACDGATEETYLRGIGYDQFDALIAGIRDATVWIDTLVRQDPKARAATWDQWIDMLYSEAEDPDLPGVELPDETSTVYGALYHYEEAIQDWITELTQQWRTWPECLPDGTGGYANPPCRMFEWGGTFDQDAEEEYAMALMYMRDYIIPPLQWTRGFLKQMVEELRGGGSGLNALGGRNPVVYEWDDTRGHHWIKTRVANFKIPKIEKKKYGNWFAGKTCMELTNFTSESGLDHKGRSAATYDKCWIQVWRFDQPKNLGLLGTWNPFRRPLTKKSTCYYNFDRVGLKNEG